MQKTPDYNRGQAFCFMKIKMAKKHVNENYIHSCGCNLVDISGSITSITHMGYSLEQVSELLDFYLFEAPISRTDKNRYHLKSLKEYGWAGSSALSKLEGRLLKASGIGVFCFIKSDSIDETLESMNLQDKMCCEHPRAVLKQNVKTVLHEDGSVEIRQHESRLECLFRHMRNSIAHNHTYMFDNGNILIEDCDDNDKVTARIMIPKQALLDWMSIVKKEEKSILETK